MAGNMFTHIAHSAFCLQEILSNREVYAGLRLKEGNQQRSTDSFGKSMARLFSYMSEHIQIGCLQCQTRFTSSCDIQARANNKQSVLSYGLGSDLPYVQISFMGFAVGQHNYQK